MFGYSHDTVLFWTLETVLYTFAAVLLLCGLLRRWRWVAFVPPVLQLSVRLAQLLLNPSELGVELTYDRALLLVGVCACSVLMFFFPNFRYATAVGCGWQTGMIWPDVRDVPTYFSFGHELTWVAVLVLCIVATYGLLAAVSLRNFVPRPGPAQNG